MKMFRLLSTRGQKVSMHEIKIILVAINEKIGVIRQVRLIYENYFYPKMRLRTWGI